MAFQGSIKVRASRNSSNLIWKFHNGHRCSGGKLSVTRWVVLRLFMSLYRCLRHRLHHVRNFLFLDDLGLKMLWRDSLTTQNMTRMSNYFLTCRARLIGYQVLRNTGPYFLSCRLDLLQAKLRETRTDRKGWLTKRFRHVLLASTLWIIRLIVH